MNYPVDCNTSSRKTEYLYRAQEVLRLLHNQIYLWEQRGFSSEEYNQLPTDIKNKFAYTPQLSADDKALFLKEEFLPRSEAITQEICMQRVGLKKSKRWSIAISDISKQAL